MNKILFKSAFTLGLMVSFFACKKAAQEPEQLEQELITTLTVTLVNKADATDKVTVSFKDKDGDGGNAPVISPEATLKANAEYTGSISLLDETKTPAEDINEEINGAKKVHQFFFIPTSLDVTTTYLDFDEDSRPVGLTFLLKTKQATTGTLQIVLRHALTKSGVGVSGGDITNAGGETDAEATFKFAIK